MIFWPKGDGAFLAFSPLDTPTTLTPLGGGMLFGTEENTWDLNPTKSHSRQYSRYGSSSSGINSNSNRKIAYIRIYL